MVKIGELMTMVVAVEGPASADVLVRQCVAHDGSRQNPYQLTDEVRPGRGEGRKGGQGEKAGRRIQAEAFQLRTLVYEGRGEGVGEGKGERGRGRRRRASRCKGWKREKEKDDWGQDIMEGGG